MADRTRLAALALSTALITQVIPAHATVLGPVTIQFLDPAGNPVHLGTVTWSAGGATSAAPIPVSALGTAYLPYVPYAAGTLALENTLSDKGNFSTTAWNVDFTSPSLTLVLLDDPDTTSFDVHVRLPNGLPVPGAAITTTLGGWESLSNAALPNIEGSSGGSYSCHSATCWISPPPVGSTWSTRYGIYENFIQTSWKTDSTGTAHIEGFDPRLSRPGWSVPLGRGSVTYSDGVLSQSMTFDPAGQPDVYVTLLYMPWVETDIDSATATKNALVPVTVSVSEAPAGAAAVRGAVSGVSVRIVPPAGAKQRCKNRKLSTTTGSSGKATVKVCATKSGAYKIVTSGAVSAGSVNLKVRRAPSMPPTALGARSSSAGTMTVAWNPPVYSGGAPVKQYVLKLKSGSLRKTVIVKRGTGAYTNRTVTISGLARNRIWTVTAYAKTKYGTSDGTSTTAIVQ